MTSWLWSLDSVASGASGNVPFGELGAPPHADANTAATRVHFAPARIVDSVLSPSSFRGKRGTLRHFDAGFADGEFPRNSGPAAKCRGPYSLGGYLWSLRWSERRWIPSRRAASDTLPSQSESTRWMCSHSVRASDGG